MLKTSRNKDGIIISEHAANGVKVDLLMKIWSYPMITTGDVLDFDNDVKNN